MNSILLEKLKTLLVERRGISLSSDGLETISKFNSGATVDEINSCNQYFNNLLPIEYLELLVHYNGVELFNLQDIDGFRFLDTLKIIEVNELEKQNNSDYDPRIILFCEIIGEGNYLGFRVNENGFYVILDCFHEEKPTEWRVIGYSFDDLLEKIIDEKGTKFWLG